MAGFVHCVRFRTPTGYVTSGAGAADASFPHANAADIRTPHRPWKSASSISAGTTFYGVDFGSAIQLQGVGIDNVNVTTVTLEAASDSSFSSNVISQIVPVGENLVERSLFSGSTGYSYGRLKAFVDLSGTSFDAQSRQYWRIRAGVASVDSSEPQFFVGSVAWCRTLERWDSGTSSYGEQPLEATRLNDDYAGGGADPVIVGNPSAAIHLSGSPADRTTMRSSLMQLLRHGLGRPFLFYRNNSDTADFYICQRAGDVTVNTTFPTVIEFSDFIMRSAV